jgi:hypothetical protein
VRADIARHWPLQAAEPREFSGPLGDNLKKHGIEARCGIYVVDLISGGVVHWARIEVLVSELYDVAVLPDRVHTEAGEGEGKIDLEKLQQSPRAVTSGIKSATSSTSVLAMMAISPASSASPSMPRPFEPFRI